MGVFAQLLSCTHFMVLRVLHAWLTITTNTARNGSFAKCVLGKPAALVLIVSQEASKQLPSSVVTGDDPHKIVL